MGSANLVAAEAPWRRARWRRLRTIGTSMRMPNVLVASRAHQGGRRARRPVLPVSPSAPSVRLCLTHPPAGTASTRSAVGAAPGRYSTL